MVEGHCHCGAISYEVKGEPVNHMICHCADCQRHSGAPMVAWGMFANDALTITRGEPKTYKSSTHGRRQFCGDCGTGLFYFNNEMLPDLVDIQSATLDDPNINQPTGHIQIAERLDWVESMNDLPKFDRYPPM